MSDAIDGVCVHGCSSFYLIKKTLSQRMYELADGTRVQRDWYSSFLMYCIGTDLQNISRYKCKRYFDELYAKYLEKEEQKKRIQRELENLAVAFS